MDKPKPRKLRKWHFLFLGCALVFLSAFLWYWNWRVIGLPRPLRPEHYLVLTNYVVGIVVFGLFIFRLTKDQVTIMLLWLILVNVIGALVTAWIYRTYPDFFDLLRPIDMQVYDPAYIADWREYFLTPVIYALHVGLLLLWAESLVMFLVRQPNDEPG
jgi:hypothetical protein